MPNIAAILLVLLVATSAQAKPKPKGKGSVKVHMDRAAKAHKDGKFDVALKELEAAYALEPQPKLVYAIAQVHAKLDNCDEAITHYEKFIASTKEKDKQAVARQAIAACKKRDAARKSDKPDSGVFRAKKPDDEPESKPEEAEPAVEANLEAKVETKLENKPEPVKPEPAPEPKPEPQPEPLPPPPPPTAATTVTTVHTPWYRDAIGDALVISGVGVTIGSYFTFRSAQNANGNAERAGNLDDYNQLKDSAERKQLYSYLLAGGGLSLVVAGVLRYSLRENPREVRGVAIVPTSDGGLVTWSGGF